MGFLDDVVKTKVIDKSCDLKYVPSHNNMGKSLLKLTSKVGKKVINKTNKTVKNEIGKVYTLNRDWCKVFDGTDIYNQCCKEISKQLLECCGLKVDELYSMIEINFSNDYWFKQDIQKKYTENQLRRIEKELEKKTCKQLCEEMKEYVLDKVTKEFDDNYELLEKDIFKIKNRLRV